MPDSWSWGNFGATYGATASGLSFYENTQQFKLTPGNKVGDKVNVKAARPYDVEIVYCGMKSSK